MDYEDVSKVFDCSLIQSFKKKFFSEKLPTRTEDKIVSHLLKCKACSKFYISYAKDIGIKNFNIPRYALKLYKGDPTNCPGVYKCLMDLKRGKLQEVLSEKWTRAAKDFDISELMNMKAFRDLSIEYNSPTHMDYSDFYQYMALKYAKRIDFLELCLFKEYKEQTKAESEG